MTPSDHDPARTASNRDPEPTSHATPAQAGSEETQVQHQPPTAWVALPTLPVVPGYTLTRKVAEGGMGIVYAADDPIFDREVAVKVMRPGQDSQRFVIESKVTARLPHPGIPPVHTLGTLDDGRPFLAMKMIQGRTLAEVLKEANRDDLPRLLRMYEQICQTVGFAHARGFIHRDLKPANVMVGAFGEVLVMDWGLAKELAPTHPNSEGPERVAAGHPSATAGDVAETVAGQVKGTPAYMAPEQARGEHVDARADVFALGGILAVILTGRPPFLGDTVIATILKAAQAELEECHEKLDVCEADPELVAVVRTCLAPDVSDRYANGEAVAAAVAAYRAGVEERLRRAERDRAVSEAEAREQRKRRKVQLALAAAVALLLMASGGFAWYSDAKAEQTKRKQAEFDATEAREEGVLRATRAAAAERDRIAKETARQGIASNIKLAIELRRQYKFALADASLIEAVALAKGGAPELLAEVQQARADLAFVVKLDDIRFHKWTWIAEEGGKGQFNTRIASPEYRAAFAASGFDLTTLTPVDAAKRIAASGVKAELVAAVDDWALHEPDATLRGRLLEIARKADPGAWTDRLRNPTVWEDEVAVAKLAADADPGTTPPAVLSLLAELMRRRGLDPAPLLSAARVKHPTDFELAFALGQSHTKNSKEGQQIGPYEAARALRPENLTVLNNLGIALDEKGDIEGAIAVYREAIKHDPKASQAHYNLGIALKGKGDIDGAIAAYKEAIKHDPKLASAHTNLGAIYRQQKKYVEAVACAREAIKADSNYSYAHALLGETLRESGDIPGARVALTEAARPDKRWAPLLAKLPPAVPVAPAPREVNR